MASIGKLLIRYRIAARSGSIECEDTLSLPEPIQYACFDPDSHILYTACSDGEPGCCGSRHMLIALHVGLNRIHQIGQPVSLPGRPIHICHDAIKRILLVSYDGTVKLSIHSLAKNGTIQGMIAKGGPAECNYPHQAAIAPDGAGYVLVCRGSDPAGEKAEQPGGLFPFKFDGHKIQYGSKISSNDGYGFGPRNIVFGKAGDHAYAVLERQNLLLSYKVNVGGISAAPLKTQPTTFWPATNLPQIAGAVRLHPSGKFLYVANRTHRTRGGDAITDISSGANTISAYSLDPITGIPTFLKEQETGGIHPRTISISDDGQLLVAAHVRKAFFQHGGSCIEIPASIAVFRVHENGHIAPIKITHVDIGRDLLFWSSFIGWNRQAGSNHND
ncbi:lactonase family protein [Allopusillimonas soli]|nr:beta-propeller fold lactonase family protein [Allopusillimonas soli]